MRPPQKPKGYRRIIPSMTALVEFEAAARLASFTDAAVELGVSQAAVSRQIKTLEETLGVRLFHRAHRSIILTSEGELLYQGVSEAMQRIAGVFDRIEIGVTQQELVLAATAAFSQCRLMPRLAQLKLMHPQLQLRLITLMFKADLRHNDVDVAIRYGNGAWRDGTASLIFDEEVFPVCSPGWLRTHGEPATLEALARQPLIESDSTTESWMGWDEWFHAVGHPPPTLNFALRCSLYTDAIQAARYGQGIAMGWGRLVQDMIQAGELVRIDTATCKPADAYYLVVPHGKTLSPVVASLVDWLRRDLPAERDIVAPTPTPTPQ